MPGQKDHGLALMVLLIGANPGFSEIARSAVDFDVTVDFQAEAVPTLLRALRTTAPVEGVSAAPRPAGGQRYPD